MKYIVRIDDEEYAVEIQDLHSRPIVATIDGETFEVMPANVGAAPVRLPIPAAQAAAAEPKQPPAMTTPVLPSRGGGLGGATVRAPLPGLILSILVKPGDTVAKGQELFVIEAMKMKNVVRSHRDGVIAELAASPGETVSHNAVVLTFSEG